MAIGNRLRALRESKSLSQGDIENGLVCCAATSHGLKRTHRIPACEDVGPYDGMY